MGRKRKILVMIGAVGLIAFGLLSYDRFQAKQLTSGKYKNYNVLLITLDTTRADHLPIYGYRSVKTPALASIAESSLVFEDAVAHAPLTLPAHASILTGMLPQTHGIRDNAGYFLNPKIKTLAEFLKSAGYATSAFVSSFVLDSRWQLNRGFDLYFDNFNLEEFKQLNPQNAQRRAQETEAEAERWLEANQDRHFFSWVHFYDPHEPYDPPEPFQREYERNPYDGEIAYMDQYIGKLYDRLKTMGIADTTILVIAGDHGEGLGQHDEATHAIFIYQTTQHVPLLFHIPGAAKNRIRGVVRQIDIAPTILDLLGIPIPFEFQGASLLPMMNGKKDESRVGYSESLYAELHYGWSPLKSLTTQDYKFIEAPKPELYDRRKDPDETRNLFLENPDRAKDLRDQLHSWITRDSGSASLTPQKLDPETEERLRSLGYLGNSVRSTAESRRIDPKDKTQLARSLHQASILTQEQRYQEAIDILMPVLNQTRRMFDARFLAGVSFIGINQYEKGIDELLKALALRPENTMALYNLGYASEMQGDRRNALEWYLKVLNYEPQHLYASLKVAYLYRLMEQPEKAKPYFHQAMDIYERFLKNTKTDGAKSALHSTIGELYFRAGDFNNAKNHFQSAITLNPNRRTLHYNLASIYEAEGNAAAALDEYIQETKVDPSNYKAFNNLGLLYRNSGQLDQAAECFRKVMELQPDQPRGYKMLASTLNELGRSQEAQAILQKMPGPLH